MKPSKYRKWLCLLTGHAYLHFTNREDEEGTWTVITCVRCGREIKALACRKNKSSSTQE